MPWFWSLKIRLSFSYFKDISSYIPITKLLAMSIIKSPGSVHMFHVIQNSARWLRTIQVTSSERSSFVGSRDGLDGLDGWVQCSWRYGKSWGKSRFSWENRGFSWENRGFTREHGGFNGTLRDQFWNIPTLFHRKMSYTCRICPLAYLIPGGYLQLEQPTHLEVVLKDRTTSDYQYSHES